MKPSRTSCATASTARRRGLPSPPPPGIEMITRSFCATVCWPMPRKVPPEASLSVPAAPFWPPSRPRGGWSMRS